MAKYNVTYSCGHDGVVDLSGPGKDRERKLEWYSTSAQCPDCYRAAKKAEQEATPICLTVDCNPYDQIVILHFGGNTMQAKEQIKAIGYRWGELPALGAWGMLDLSRPPMRWHKILKINNPDDLKKLDAALKEAGAITANIKNNMTIFDIAAFGEVAAKRAEEAAEAEAKKAAIEAKKATVTRPPVPAKLSGKSWNQKIYGSKGRYTIYPDGEKTSLTDAEAAEIEEYLLAKAKYKKAIAEIEEA